jgi:FKBP-type peptidyl-prolyl cis-trans isomerase
MIAATSADETCAKVEVLNVSSDGGILKCITLAGTTPIPSNVIARILYTGKLVDGTVFDSTSFRGEPFTFKVGNREAVLALDLAVAGMKMGEKCHLICTPEYAYGKVKVGLVPPYSTVEYDIELLGWDHLPSDGLAILPIVTISVFLVLVACTAKSLME